MKETREYVLRADDVDMWQGKEYPSQAQIDRAAKAADDRGWNGVALDLYRGLDWVAFEKPSEGVL